MKLAMATALIGASTLANAELIEESPSAGAMVADAVLARPLYFVLSQAGALVYGVTLPFTLLGGNADEAAEALVVTPLQAAFVRCLGCGKIENEVGDLREGDGKTIRHFVTLNTGATFLDTEGKKTTDLGFGVYMGTHFALNDKSRFDVMLGVKQIGDIEVEKPTTIFKDSMTSYQIVSRFGRQIFWDMDLMFKLGAHSWSVERTTSAGAQPELSTSGIDFLWGVGVDKDLGRHFRAGLDYTSYGLEDTDKAYDAKIDTLDVNLTYMF
ncbi:outer membrane beta-barrel protein [Thalassolituus sp. LLYu03]|uniref:outer membrane beta-barrel protein n=1 Tax=Thalassolituus sp. LLYu03 TaxID=3421656 RepID=UPI003D2C47FA